MDIRCNPVNNCDPIAFIAWELQRRGLYCPANFDDLIRWEAVFDMPNVKVRENEPFEVALRRFKRTCEKAGVVAEVRSREFYEKPTSVRKREKAAAVKRNIKNLKRELNRRVRLY